MKEDRESTGGLVRADTRSLTLRSNSLVTRGIREIESANEDRQEAHVLIVDDEEGVRNAIFTVLAASGYQCRSVAGGQEALSLLESEGFHLLIHDILNAPLDGYSLLLQTRQRFPNLPIVVSTAIHDLSLALACFQAGAWDYLLLPYEREQLLSAVRRALDPNRLKEKRIWKEGLYRYFVPVVDEHLTVPLLSGERKHVRDLKAGDCVPVMLDNGWCWYHLYERDGFLGAIDFMPTFDAPKET